MQHTDVAGAPFLDDSALELAMVTEDAKGFGFQCGVVEEPEGGHGFTLLSALVGGAFSSACLPHRFSAAFSSRAGLPRARTPTARLSIASCAAAIALRRACCSSMRTASLLIFSPASSATSTADAVRGGSCGT